jgi:hypothetical protein
MTLMPNRREESSTNKIMLDRMKIETSKIPSMGHFTTPNMVIVKGKTN